MRHWYSMRSALVLGGFMVTGCGSSTPTTAITPTPVPTVAPTPAAPATPEPTPVPTPSPCTAGLCEAPVTNNAAADRLNVRLYTVVDSAGGVRPGYTADTAIPIGFQVTVDATAHDAHDAETLGQGEVEFFFSDPSLVRIRGNHTHQRRLIVVAKGSLEVWATLDGVRSNTLTLTFE